MTETTTLRQRLLPELEAELGKTRRILGALPDGSHDFSPHPKSMPLAKLAGHVVDLPTFITMILTSPDVNLATANLKPFALESKQQALAQFDQNADQAISTLKNTSDQTFEQHWAMAFGSTKLFSGQRYEAYREFGVNHMIHHRAQLGVYIRSLDHPLPGTYGPSADGM